MSLYLFIHYRSNYFLYPYLDIGLTGVCRWDVIGIVPIAMRSAVLRGIVGIDVLRLNVIGILGPGRKKLLLYNSDEASLATRSSLFSLHFPSAKTRWVLTSPSLLLSVVVYVLLGGLLWVTRWWLCRWWTLLVLASLARQQRSNVKVRLSLHTSQVAHQARAYSGFCSKKPLGVFLLPPGWDASPSQSYPSINVASTYLYTWVERGTVRVEGLGQEHNTMSPARA